MSNLGPYQDFTTAAGKAGGVANLLGIIEKDAVNAAKPALYTKGGAAGALLAAVVMFGGSRYLDKRKADRAKADEAKRQLMAEFGGLEVEGDADDTQSVEDAGLG